MTRRASFTQANVARLLTAAKEAGYRLVRLELKVDGTLTLIAEIDPNYPDSISAAFVGMSGDDDGLVSGCGSVAPGISSSQSA